MVDNYKINRHKPSLPQTCDLLRNTCAPGLYNRFSRTELTKAKLSLLLRNRVSTIYSQYHDTHEIHWTSHETRNYTT